LKEMNKCRLLMVLLFILIVQSAHILHPINMAVTDVTYQDKKFMLKFKFFADDLQGTLSSHYKVPYDIINKSIDDKVNKSIHQYIVAKFKMYINGALVNPNYKKAFRSDEVVYVEYELPYLMTGKIRAIRIANTLQFESFPEQKHIVNIRLYDDLKVLQFENQSGEYIKEILF